MAGDMDRIERLLAELDGLYQRDPAAFEASRREILETAMRSFPAHWQGRARGLQFVIDAQLRRCRDPISRLNCMIELFWEGVRQFQEVLEHPQEELARRQRSSRAAVIPLHPGKTIH